MSLFRSWMFVPGNQKRKIEKVQYLDADIIIYDLEDSIALKEKETARHMVRSALQQDPYHLRFVRVNDVHSSFFEKDLSEMVCSQLAGIMLPKASSADEILEVDQRITKLEQLRGMEIGSIEIVPLIETACGLYASYEIAKSSNRVSRLAFGSVDYALDINAELSVEGTELLFARSQLVVHSRAAGIEAPIDAVYIHLQDHEGLSREAKLARQLGFQGKLVVHPDQINIVNDVFSPTLEQIHDAHLIVTAYDEALQKGMAAIQLDGRMIDLPVANRARQILEIAKKLG